MHKLLCTNMLVLVFFCNGAFASEGFPMKYLSRIREKYQLPAVGVGLILKDESPEIYVSGIRKIGANEKATIEDKWHIGSCTKSMTATLAAIIINSEKYPSLTWETKLNNIFDFDIHPDFKNITLSELLAHRSGIEDPEEWESLDNMLSPLELKNDVMEIRAAVSEFFLTKAPGYNRMNAQEAHYSNMGYTIVGAILEKVTGKPWEKLISENIFIPLEMTSAGFGSPANKNLQNPDQPWGHREEEVEKQINIIPDYNDNPAWMGPAGTVHCSMSDWLKYINIHIDGYNGLNTKILPASAFHILHQPIDKNSEFNAGGWMNKEVDGFKSLQASGSNTFNVAIVVVLPKLEAAIIFVTNYPSVQKIQDAFSEILEWGMNCIQSKKSVLNIEQEKILWSWSKKLIDEEHFRLFAEKYNNSHPEAEKNGYGPGAMVVSNR